MCRHLPGKNIEQISLNIAKFNIHSLIIIGGFEVRIEGFVQRVFGWYTID